MNKKKLENLSSQLIMLLVLLVVLFPMIYAIIVSTQTNAEYFRFPPRITPGSGILENYSEAWHKGNLGRLLFNSTLISLVVAFGKIILSILAGFTFVYFDFKGKFFFFIIILITQMLPLPVRIVPTYMLMSQLNWVNTYWALTIPFFASATGTLLFRQLYMMIPRSFADAAKVDGVNSLQFLWHIVIPLSKTNIAALFLIEFIFIWNQYLWPLIVGNSQEVRVVQIGLKQLIDTDAAVNWNVLMSGTVLGMIPPLIILIVFQSSLIKGLSLADEK
ncbi:MAG: ABC transporter permease [Spirochaetaceae bacterium 4572_59]|nr:MAG: ABC transporter permease [Spirochaetaceae bacterium 4572_59]